MHREDKTERSKMQRELKIPPRSMLVCTPKKFECRRSNERSFKLPRAFDCKMISREMRKVFPAYLTTPTTILR